MFPSLFIAPSTPVRRLLPVLLASLLGACATVGPDYRVPETPVPAAWQAVSTVGTIPETGDGLARWWEQLSDPQLTSLIEDALGANPDLRSASAALRAARANRDLASANRFPTVGASTGVTRSTALGADKTLYAAGFDASWEPDVFGGARRALEAAEADLDASVADMRATRVSLVAEVALNYVELRAYQARLAIARDNLGSQSETLQITDWRAQAGLVGSLEVEQARSNRDTTRAAIPTLDSGRAAAEHRLAILTGRTPGSLHEQLSKAGTETLPTLPRDIALRIPAETLRQRPDVQAAERRLAAETARLGQAEAARYPSFSLSGSIGLQALGLSTFSGGGQIARSLAGAVAGPVFDAGRLRAQVEIQDARRAQKRAAYDKAVLTALARAFNLMQWGQSLLLGLLTVALQALLFMFLDFPVWDWALQLFSWLVPKGVSMEIYVALATTGAAGILLYFIFLLTALSGGLQYFSSREIVDASSLLEDIEKTGKGRQIRGLVREA